MTLTELKHVSEATHDHTQQWTDYDPHRGKSAAAMAGEPQPGTGTFCNGQPVEIYDEIVDMKMEQLEQIVNGFSVAPGGKAWVSLPPTAEDRNDFD